MLLGRNGAGKTTTLRTIMGLWAASQGAVVFDGRRSAARGGHGDAAQPARTPEIAQRGIAYVPENMGIFGDLRCARTCCSPRASARTLDALDARGSNGCSASFRR